MYVVRIFSTALPTHSWLCLFCKLYECKPVSYMCIDLLYITLTMCTWREEFFMVFRDFIKALCILFFKPFLHQYYQMLNFCQVDCFMELYDKSITVINEILAKPCCLKRDTDCVYWCTHALVDWSISQSKFFWVNTLCVSVPVCRFSYLKQTEVLIKGASRLSGRICLHYDESMWIFLSIFHRKLNFFT